MIPGASVGEGSNAPKKQKNINRWSDLPVIPGASVGEGSNAPTKNNPVALPRDSATALMMMAMWWC
eukprot:9488965-Pyramimonas_sp.AAC.1